MTPVTTTNMSDLIEAFASYLEEERMLQPTTVGRYVRVMRRFASHLAETHDTDTVALELVSKQELCSFLRAQSSESEEPSRSIWNARLSALRAFYRFLYKQELVTVNPADKVERRRVHPRERHPLSFDEVISLVSTVETESATAYQARNVAIIQVFFHCALRVAEVVSLNVEQVDLTRYMVRDIRTKGDKRLSAMFNDVVAEALQRYLEHRAALGVEGNEPALFLSNRRTRISVRAVQDLVARYAKRAGISRTVTPHLLRHSSATEFAEMGTPLRVVQEICGHASVTTTQRYVHTNGRERRRAIDQLGARWSERTEATPPPKNKGGLLGETTSQDRV